MLRPAPTFALCICFLAIEIFSCAQIKNIFVDSSRYESFSNVFFFTNRPMKLKKDSTIQFENRWKKSTGKLYFVVYNPQEDSLMLKFQVEKTGDDITKIVGTNVLSKAFDDLYHKKGIRHYEIIIPGYGKTFKNQLNKFMFKLKGNYSDPISRKIAIVTFAWGDEWSVLRYYRGKRSSKEGAKDFAIFQSLLENFLKDHPFSIEKPRDFSVGLTCFSMGNEMFRQYMRQRKKRGQELVKTYESITFVGSDVAWDSFKPGKGFHDIEKMTDNVDIFKNKNDVPLAISSYFNLKKRLGRNGPKKKYPGPEIVNVLDISGLQKLSDITGHNYMFKNPIIIDAVLKSYLESSKKAKN